ncbi:MAG: hypothetical protein GY832_07575 [Chloroflexi bacterium]|nr:hypothetical protein [Chloroflexota bacterium]
MPSKGSALCSSGGERWGGDEGHHPETTNHRNKANPVAMVKHPLVVTDNATPPPTPHPASHLPRPKETSQRTTWPDQGETARERTGARRQRGRSG